MTTVLAALAGGRIRRQPFRAVLLQALGAAALGGAPCALLCWFALSYAAFWALLTTVVALIAGTILASLAASVLRARQRPTRPGWAYVGAVSGSLAGSCLAVVLIDPARTLRDFSLGTVDRGRRGPRGLPRHGWQPESQVDQVAPNRRARHQLMAWPGRGRTSVKPREGFGDGGGHRAAARVYDGSGCRRPATRTKVLRWSCRRCRRCPCSVSELGPTELSVAELASAFEKCVEDCLTAAGKKKTATPVGFENHRGPASLGETGSDSSDSENSGQALQGVADATGSKVARLVRVARNALRNGDIASGGGSAGPD